MSASQPGSGRLTDPESWVDQHGDYLFRYALSRLGNRELAEDLVQETFLAALRAGDRFDGRASPRSWMVGILKHKMVDYLRKQAHERPASDLNPAETGFDDLFDQHGSWRVPPAGQGDNPRELLEKKEFWEAFRCCLAKLPERLAAIFLLREKDGFSTGEICAALNVTPGNLSVLLYRARMQLRRCLEINWFSTQTEKV